MPNTFDCILAGTCVVDVVIHPIPLTEPLGRGREILTRPHRLVTGGLVANAGIAMATLGAKVAALTLVGDDDWAWVLRRRLQRAGVNVEHVLTHASAPTGVTAALVDRDQQHSFAHCAGAPRLMDRRTLLDRLDLFASSRFALIGYYSMLPQLEEDLPDVLGEIRATGCRTAMDAACGGGALQPLDRILPQLDIYFPSRDEGRQQTGSDDPETMIGTYRRCGAPGLLGVKLGVEGALLSPAPDEFFHVPAITPPGPVLDTVGAGDAFFGGLLVGLLKGMSLNSAARLAAATGACCVTGSGGALGLKGFEETMQLADLTETDLTETDLEGNAENSA